MLLDTLKVEYAFETARIRLYLPSKGETWFFVDDSLTLKDFKEQVKAEDKHATHIQILDANNSELGDET